VSAVLAIDTTTRGGSVALAEDGEVRALVHHDPATGYAESLLGLCDVLRERASQAWSALDGVAVVRGPGSFTGLRIGIMTAKTLAFARGWTLWAADSLPMVAAAAGLDDSTVRVGLLDAGAGHVFAGVLPPDALQADVERLPLENLPSWLEARAAGRPIALESALASTVREHVRAALLRPVDSLAGVLAERASLQRPPAVPVEPDRLVPLYASASQAERVHGIDLREQVHRRIEPTRWE
jgi:tRNA threonylcarbamoyl adenosine modification protein YeaZ